MLTLQSMRLMAWFFTVPPFAMTLLFAATLLSDGYERAIALYQRAYIQRARGSRRQVVMRRTSPFDAFRSREAGSK